MLEKYQDYDPNPGAEPMDRTPNGWGSPLQIIILFVIVREGLAEFISAILALYVR